MEQSDSSSTNPESGLNTQPTEFAAAFSPDENFENILKNLLDSGMEKTKNQKIEILEKWFPKLTIINFTKVMDLFPQDDHFVITYLLLSIASKATNLSDFQIMDGSANITLRSMSDEMVGTIGRMTKLEVLGVENFSISFCSLMELCGKLPSLKTLFFTIKAEPNFAINDIEVFQKSFGSLEIFQFFSVSDESEFDEDFRKSLTVECIRYLTNLRIVGDPNHFVDMLPTCLDSKQLAGDEWISNLSYLTLYLNKDVPETALNKFPDVMLMEIWMENNQMNNREYLVPGLMEFQRLTHLFMSDLDMNNSDYLLEQFLEVYGKRLTQLILQFQLRPINFESIFDMICCSHFDSLELLAMKNLDVQRPCMPLPQIGEVSCESLKELNLEFAIEQSYYPTYVHLSKILSVPNLEKVKLIRVPTTLDELWKTMVSVIKRTILKKVTHFQLELSYEQIIETEIDGRINCCHTIEEELFSDKKEGEIVVEVKQLTTPYEPQP